MTSFFNFISFFSRLINWTYLWAKVSAVPLVRQKQCSLTVLVHLSVIRVKIAAVCPFSVSRDGEVNFATYFLFIYLYA